MPEPFDIRVPVPLGPVAFIPEPPALPEVDFSYRVARYERRQTETNTHKPVWVYICVDDGLPLPEWMIAVITAWDGEEGDELFENVATVKARTAEDAERIYGQQHPYDRDYNFIYARPAGAPW